MEIWSVQNSVKQEQVQTQSLISFKQVHSHSLFSFEQEEVQTQSLSRIRNKAHTLCTPYGNILYQEQEQTQSLFSYIEKEASIRPH